VGFEGVVGVTGECFSVLRRFFFFVVFFAGGGGAFFFWGASFIVLGEFFLVRVRTLVWEGGF